MTFAPLPTPNQRLLQFAMTPNGRKLLSSIIDYFHGTLEGAAHIPDGGALLVSNHALFALDSFVLGALLTRDLGRNPRFLVDRKIWQIPGLQQAICAVGGLPGEPLAAQALLRRGELVIVYPGGVDDSLKLSRQRYQLQWKSRAGFAKVALRARVPIVPVVGLGIDEMYTVLAREHWLGRRLFGSERYDLPVMYGAFGTLLPRRVAQTYVVLPPIEPAGNADSAAAVEELRAATYDAIESKLRIMREQHSG